MRDPYVYPNSTILKNKFQIKDEKTFNEMEAEYTSMRIRELGETPIQGNYNFQHFCEIHKYIFQDIFEWAGIPRTIDIEKQEPSIGGLSIEYEKNEAVQEAATKVLHRLNERPWESVTLDKQAEFLTLDIAALWKIHSFREGNTRTTIIFCCDFAESKGMSIDRSLFEKNSVYMRTALVAANAIFSDLGDLSKPEYLNKIIKDSIERGCNKKPRESTMQGILSNYNRLIAEDIQEREKRTATKTNERNEQVR